ncbi:conserved hypothetical protein [Beutenbergia cavernae DSM 12333]|uniref:Mycothiol-dependent maleylpyruvate isomerase metal-binding domain-containing protein n=1 Tax=Beutenbergia cavernae (strain ATCC BAA-8 / DSM 12333 / CCUG 43141 / JCM 11478 / NBRC 16432 / NCIMB 13614 / HKI 0122) TaxID=471853 RepID=C5BXA8_BEUC1|nr:maleylpyruvate isomerase family mycothiol-dependent enzyme [Beutenbergia cavernae]ACQ78783.1 conserved hypothetical protein [Beutenbergia cavernae DSM 12333]
MADTGRIIAETRAERARLVGILEGLAPAQWAAPSLCDGWRVREVVAHITMPYRIGGLGYLAGLARAGFRFHVYADRAARADTARMDDAALLASLRDNIDHPWRPPGGGALGALSHDVIHGLDITEPLGLPGPPAERVALVLAESKAKQYAYFGVDLDGVRLEATDADVAIGDGRTVRMPVRDVLLVVTGRSPMPAPAG